MSKFRPVWDRPEPPEVPPAPAIPLPPAEVFVPSQPPAAMFAPRTPAPLTLPDFNRFAQASPALDAHMREVAHSAAVTAELKSMGLIEET